MKTHQAKARCRKCEDIMVSKHGGDFVSCKCGASYIDQERWSGLYVGLGGDAEFVERTCPDGCKDHMDD